MKIQTFIEEHGTAVNYFPLYAINFCEETTADIATFCRWLSQHSGVTQVSFRGRDLSKFSSEILIQLFGALAENSRVQDVELSGCAVEKISSAAAIESIAACLERKTKISITNQGPCETLLTRICRGAADYLVLDHNTLGKHHSGSVKAVCGALAERDRIFKHISLRGNALSGCFSEDLLRLFAAKTEVLDLSENPLGLSTFMDWELFIRAIQANSSLRELYMRDCRFWSLDLHLGLAPELRQAEQDKFRKSLLDFVRTTKLTKVDISENGLELASLESLRDTAIRDNPKLELLCGHPAEEKWEEFGAEDTGPASAATQSTVRTGTATMVAAPLLLSQEGLAAVRVVCCTRSDPDEAGAIITVPPAHSPPRMVSTSS